MFNITWEHPTKDIHDPYTQTNNPATLSLLIEEDELDHLQGTCNDYDVALLVVDIVKELDFPLYEEQERPDEEEDKWIEFETSEDGDGYYINVHGISKEDVDWVVKVLDKKLKAKQWQNKVKLN